MEPSPGQDGQLRPASSSSRLVLLSCGSNAENQLSHSQAEDSHAFLPCELASSSHSSSTPPDWPASTFPPPGTTRVASLAFGANHTVALIGADSPEPSASIWGTGDGRGGQLGELVSDAPVGFRRLAFPAFPSKVLDHQWRPTRIAASWTTTFVTFESDENGDPDGGSLLLAMGTNDFGELANGHRGPAGGSHRWHVFQNERIVDLKAGPRHVVLVVEATEGGKKRVLGWGQARHGQLASSPLHTLSFNLAPPATSVDTPGSSEAPPPAVPSSLPAVVLAPTALSPPGPSPSQLALGLAHTLLFSQRKTTPALHPIPSTLHILGRSTNPATDISLPPSSSAIVQIASTWSASVLLVANPPTLHLFPKTGGPKISSLPCGPTAVDGETVVVRAGSEHVLVRLETAEGQREVWGWGWNEHGNMGDGTTKDWKDGLGKVWPPSVWGGGGRGEGAEVGKVVDCWAGNGTSWVLIER